MTEIAQGLKWNPALSRGIRNLARKFFRKRRRGNVVSQSGGGTVLYFAVRAVLHVPKTPTTTNPSGARTSGVTHSKSWSQRQARLSAACSPCASTWEVHRSFARPRLGCEPEN